MLGQAKPTAKMKTSARFNLLKVLLQPNRPKLAFKSLQKLKNLLQQKAIDNGQLSMLNDLNTLVCC
jgi:hypothetical protein